MSELKPCPFCGGEATTRIIYPIGKHYPLHEDDIKSPVVYVGCRNCGIDIQYTPDFWNTRPAEDALSKELTEQAANYENIICEYKRDVKQAVKQIDYLKAEVERLKKQVSDREDEGYAGFVIGVEQMKKRLAEKGKEIENLKNKLKELKECIIDSRDKYMKLTEHEDFTTATISFGAYNLLNSFIEIINAPDTGKIGEN
jgi:uncharacterized coiled-coil protein SlyX